MYEDLKQEIREGIAILEKLEKRDWSATPDPDGDVSFVLAQARERLEDELAALEAKGKEPAK